MKICPSCKRYYADDTLVFCMEDGVQLDLVTDPNATFHMPPARDTDPPATLILATGQPPAGSASGTWPAQAGLGQGAPPDVTQPAGQVPPTIPAGGYAGHPPAAPIGGAMHIPLDASAAAPKKNTALIATVVVLVVVVLGLGGVSAYLYSQSGSRTPNGSGDSGSNTNSRNSNTGGGSANNNSGSSNTGGGTGGGSNTGGSNGGGGDATWLQGNFSGDGTQYDGGKWTFTYVNTNGTPVIEYPSVRCGGKWEPVSIKSNEAVFTEVITHGKDCLSNGRVVVTPTSDGALNCKWYYVGDIVGAEATLKRQ
jgi:hypothetical protein